MPCVGSGCRCKPDPAAAPAGSRRAASAWRRLALLPVLALLLGALGLFAAAPAQAQSHTVTGLALTAGSETVALSPAFSPGVTSYRAEVPAGTALVTLAPHWSGGESVFAGSRRGSTSFTRPARVRPSGTAVDLALAPDGGATELWVMVSGPGGLTTYTIDATAERTGTDTAPVRETDTAPVQELLGTVSFVSDSYRVVEKPQIVADTRPIVLQVVRSGDTSAAAGGITATPVFGTASDWDYTAVPVQLWFEAGKAITEIRYRIRSDVFIEDDETFKVALGADAGSRYRVGSPSTATVTIVDGTPVVSFARKAYTAIEGGNAEVTINMSPGSVDVPVPLWVSVADSTAVHGSDYSGPRTINVTIPAGETSKTFSIPITDDSDVEVPETFTVTLDPAPNLFEFHPRGITVATITINDNEQTPPEEEKPRTVTVAFSNVPSEHAGQTPFALDVQSGSKPAADAFTVTAGKVTGVESLDPVLWRVRVKPKSWKNVKIALGAASATVPGPARIRVQDARAKEGKDASLDFAVTLNRAASQAVTVDYATQDGTATAGADYTATSGTLTFASGETAKTVSVPLLDDAHDEGKETFTLRLSNPHGAYLRNMHRTATGVIKNDDPLQQAWLARFGRTAATHVTDAVGARLRDAPGEAAHVTIGGYLLPLGQPAAGPDDSLAARLTEVAGGLLGLGPGAGGALNTPWADQPDPRLNQAQTLPTVRLREVLQGSAFRLSLNAADADAARPRLTAWGRFAGTTFDGQEGELTLDGDVFTGTVGVDGTWDRWLAGVAVAHSQGTGAYRMRRGPPDPNDRNERTRETGDGRSVAATGQGGLEQTLTSLHPYLRYAVTDRLNVWGTVGYGWGELDLEMKNGGTVETDTRLVMGAVGSRGVVLAPAETGGFALATRTDAMLTRTSADAVTGPTGNLAATEGDAHRVRVVLEGSRAVTWEDGRRLTPTLELGGRHDWGDAETGFGLELGGRVSYADPGLGLTVEGTVRGLLAHEDSEYQEWGASGTIRLAPGAAGQGLALTVAPSWGVTASGVDGLWTRQTTQGLVPAGNQPTPGGRVQADVGYGVPAFGTGLVTPYAGTMLGDGAVRRYRVGTRVQVPGPGATGLTLDLAGTRQEPTGSQPVNQGVRVQVGWNF